jgi:methylated-DNA-[protein]-cysteine S-methyltransferase
MSEETVFYHSPVGFLEIRTSNGFLVLVSFINSWKGNKLDEKKILPGKPQRTITKKTIAQLEEYFAGKRKHFDLPLQQPGTEFQLQVWEELGRIPYGQTISYLTLSKRIGNVKAIRAVGTANGNNNICIIVPCHRVIGSNGSLVGYGGDLWRKKWLLEHEDKFENGVQSLF